MKKTLTPRQRDIQTINARLRGLYKAGVSSDLVWETLLDGIPDIEKTSKGYVTISEEDYSKELIESLKKTVPTFNKIKKKEPMHVRAVSPTNKDIAKAYNTKLFISGSFADRYYEKYYDIVSEIEKNTDLLATDPRYKEVTDDVHTWAQLMQKGEEELADELFVTEIMPMIDNILERR